MKNLLIVLFLSGFISQSAAYDNLSRVEILTNASCAQCASVNNAQYTSKIYNLLGQELRELVNQEMNIGYHDVEFNASGFASGVYVYKITSGNYSDIKMITLLK